MKILRSNIPPQIALVLAFAALLSIPFFLRSRSEMTAVSSTVPNPAVTSLGGKFVFHDLLRQSREFMGYYHTIGLTPEQEAIKREVLEAMPAACCRNSTAYTCCCPCNLSKTIWGLSNYAIAHHGLNAEKLREVVYDWVDFTNPRGYSGTACYRGGCEGSPATDGCAGMNEDDLVL